MTGQLRAIGLHKTFTLHNQGGLELSVLEGATSPSRRASAWC
ncbi:MAG TPA: hypothetical protein VNV38_17075 [Stellaceae bacterium]|jgi:alpha-D-ribose 1-methylphosphonate 5-triphosphate synthase subunit PhnL|nr:hypothetical protein [Stellaceae bacterium]